MTVDVLNQVSPELLRDMDMRPRATLRITKHELEGVVDFFRDSDDLDAFDAAALLLRPRRNRSSKGKGGQMDRGADLVMGYFAPGSDSVFPREGDGLLEAGINEEAPGILLLRYERDAEDQIILFLAGRLDTSSDVASAVERVVEALRISPTTPRHVFPVRPAARDDTAVS